MKVWEEEWSASSRAELEEWWGVGVQIRPDYGLALVGTSRDDTEAGRAAMVARAKLAAAAPEMAQLLIELEEINMDYWTDGERAEFKERVRTTLRKAGAMPSEGKEHG